MYFITFVSAEKNIISLFTHDIAVVFSMYLTQLLIKYRQQIQNKEILGSSDKRRKAKLS